MTTTDVDWNALPKQVAKVTHSVFVKGSWDDEWVEEERLHCESATWAMAPAISSATLVWQHGRIREPETVNPVNLSKVDRRGWFVKVVFTTHDRSTKNWVGFVDTISDDDYAATAAGVVTGKQRIACYGIEQALNWSRDITTIWDDAGTEKSARLPPVFNKYNEPNQSTGIAFFSHNKYRPDKVTSTIPQYWTTKAIVRYLIEKNAPKNDQGGVTINFSLVGEDKLPDWDRPEIDCTGRSVFDVMNQLINADRMLGWYAEEESDEIKIKIVTRTETDVVLEEGTVLASDSKYGLIADQDPLTTISPASSTIESADQIVCRGARRISVVGPKWQDSDLKPAWNPDLNARWWEAAKNDPNYGTLNKAEKVERNSAKRSDSELDSVGELFAVEPKDAYFPDDDDDQPYKPHPASLQLLNWIPLREGIDYSSIPNDEDHEKKPYRKPAIIHKSDDYSKQADRQASDRTSIAFHFVNDRKLVDTANIGITIDNDGRTLKLNCSDMDIAPPTAGNPPPADEQPPAILPFDDVVFILAFQEDRYCEGKWPENLATRDIVKKTVIDLGDQYQRNWIAPGVFLRYDETGTQVLAESGYVRDDTAKLTSLAKSIYTWRSRERRECNISTLRFLSTVKIGDLVTAAKSGTNVVQIGSVIDSITINTPAADQPHSVSITTNLQEANWIGLLT